MLAQRGTYAPTVLRGRRRIRDSLGGEPDAVGLYRLVLVVDGYHRFIRDGAAYACKPGSVYCLQPGSVADWEGSQGSKAELIAFTVMATELSDAVNGRAAQALVPVDKSQRQPDARSVWGVDLPVKVDEAILSQVRDQVRQITATWWIDDWSHYQANMRLVRLLDDMVRHARAELVSSTVSDKDVWIHQVVKHIESHLPSIQTIGDLARTFAVSETNLARTFRKELQETLGAYLRRRRLERAVALVRDTEHSIGAIASMVGYSSRNLLEQSWRRRYDTPPLEWRRRHRL